MLRLKIIIYIKANIKCPALISVYEYFLNPNLYLYRDVVVNFPHNIELIMYNHSHFVLTNYKKSPAPYTFTW